MQVASLCTVAVAAPFEGSGYRDSARPGRAASMIAPALHDAIPELDTTTPAVVLKLDQNVMHHGGLGVIRSLGRLGIPVYGVHEGRWAPAATSRYLNGRFIWQPDVADPGRLLSGLEL